MLAVVPDETYPVATRSAAGGIDAALTDALRRLDARLLAVVDQQERRARMLVADGVDGWDGVRNLILPPVEELTGPGGGDAPLISTEPSPLRRFGQRLGLAEVELEALLLTLAGHLEPRYQTVYGLLQDAPTQSRPTERLLYAALARDPSRHAVLAESLGPEGRLTRSGAVAAITEPHPPLGRAFDLPVDLVAGLLGANRPPVPGAAGQSWHRGTAAPARAEAHPPLVIVHGDGDHLARALELTGDEVVLVRPAVADLHTARAAWRVGLLTGALPVLDLADVPDPRSLVVAVADLIGDLGGRLVVLVRQPLPITAAHVEAAAPTWADRRAAWLAATSGSLDPEAAGALAARHRISPGEVRQVVRRAASMRPSDLDAAATGTGVEAVRHSRRVPSGHALDDLVLRDTTRDALDRLIYFVNHRDQAGEDLGLRDRFPVTAGPVVLFAGRSGTGKTAAAEAVAAAVGRPLHTVDLAQLVSKYVGETEKRIDEIFTQAQRTSAVLLFDEADAIFSTRVEHATNAAEQFGNMLVGYLLQRIERHDGLTILATNLRGGIDEAFLRRFEFRVEFPLPRDDERQRIWDLMLPPRVARADDVDLTELARTHRFSGGDIRNAALRAIFLAHRRGGPVTQADLERAIELELLEMGRLSRREPDRTADRPADRGGQRPAGETGQRPADRGELMRGMLDALEELLDRALRVRFRNEIHVVHGAPTVENVAGRRPAVSLALFRLAARRGREGLRTGFVVSAWSHRPEEESELLGVVHEVLSQAHLPPLHGRPTHLRIAESHDFDLLSRFWSSHGQPVRPSLVVDVEID